MGPLRSPKARQLRLTRRAKRVFLWHRDAHCRAREPSSTSGHRSSSCHFPCHVIVRIMVSGTIPLTSYFGSTPASSSTSNKPRVGGSRQNATPSTPIVKKRKRPLFRNDDDDEDDGYEEVERAGTPKKGKSGRVAGGGGVARSSSSKAGSAGGGMAFLCATFGRSGTD